MVVDRGPVPKASIYYFLKKVDFYESRVIINIFHRNHVPITSSQSPPTIVFWCELVAVPKSGIVATGEYFGDILLELVSAIH